MSHQLEETSASPLVYAIGASAVGITAIVLSTLSVADKLSEPTPEERIDACNTTFRINYEGPTNNRTIRVVPVNDDFGKVGDVYFARKGDEIVFDEERTTDSIVNRIVDKYTQQGGWKVAEKTLTALAHIENKRACYHDIRTKLHEFYQKRR